MIQPTRRQAWRRGLWTSALLSVAVLSLACDGSTPTAPRPDPWVPAELRLAMVSGNNQAGKVGHPLEAPFVVQVVDQHGDAVYGAVVLWDIVEGGGDLADVPKGPEKLYHETKTGVGGFASVVLTLGPRPGQNRVEGRPMFGSDSVTFVASGMADG